LQPVDGYKVIDANQFILKDTSEEMSKIDRLKWEIALPIVSYGVRFGIRANRAEDWIRIQEHLPPGWKPSKSSVIDRLYSFVIGRTKKLYNGGLEIGKTTNLTRLLDAFESEVQLYVAEYAPKKVFIHAGVVGWQGRAIIIPGRSYSGKTTLVAELVKAGATYYSDEYAVLDSDGKVHPYPRPLGIRKTDAFEQTKHKVESLGGVAGKKPLPVGLVIVSKFKKGAKWRPQRLSAGQGTLALLSNSVAIRRQPELTLAALQKIAPFAQVLKGVRGEAAVVVESVLRDWND
jgi:hypothetical protein